MSFLTKIGLLQEVETEEIRQSEEVVELQEQAEPVNVESVKSDTVIDDIYAQNGLENKDKSLYKAKEFMDAFPKEMPVVVKRSSVLSILQTAALDVNDLMEDASNRIKVLSAAKEAIIEDKADLISSAEADIEKLKAAIEELNQTIYNAKIDIDQSSNNINKEIDFLKEIGQFIGGEE